MVKAQGPFASASWVRHPQNRKSLGFLPVFWVARCGLAAAKRAQIGPTRLTSSKNLAHVFWPALAAALLLLGAVQ